MDTPERRTARLLGALEDLAAQEAAAVGTLDFAAVDALQERIASLIEWFATSGAPQLAREEFRMRLQALQARREKSAEWLETQLTRGREELVQAGAAQRRVAQIAPVYGRSPGAAGPGRSRLQAVG